MSIEQFANNAQTTLNGMIDNNPSTTTVVVSSAAGFPSSPQFRILIDSELMLVTGVSGTTWTVQRGIEGTAVASHNNGATITEVLTAGVMSSLAANPACCDFRLSALPNVAVPNADQTSVATLWAAPYQGASGQDLWPSGVGQAVPSVLAVATGKGTATAAVTIPSQAAVGTTMVAIVAWASTGARGSTPTGWQFQDFKASANQTIALYTRVTRSGDAGGSVTFNGPASTATAAQLLVLSNASFGADLSQGHEAQKFQANIASTTYSFAAGALNGTNRLLIQGIAAANAINTPSGNTDQGTVTQGSINLEVSVLTSGVGSSSVTPTASTGNTSATSATVAVFVAPKHTARISLFDGTRWLMYEDQMPPLDLTLTSGSVYDVFCYASSGVPTLEIGPAWTSTSARATNLALQNGVLVKAGDATRKYLGSVYANNTNSTEDSAANRLLWNYYNPVCRKVKKVDTTASWTYSTAAFRAWNGSSANKVTVCVGVVRHAIKLAVLGQVQSGSAGDNPSVGIGINATTVNSGDVDNFAPVNGFNSPINCNLDDLTAIGKSDYQMLEYGSGASTTFQGNGTHYQTGMTGQFVC